VDAEVIGRKEMKSLRPVEGKRGYGLYKVSGSCVPITALFKGDVQVDSCE
jgi:hypothetical protein